MNAPLPGDLLAHILTLFTASPCLVGLFDEQDVLRWANPTFRTLFGLGSEDAPTWMDMMRSARRQGLATAVQTDDFEGWLSSAASRRGKLPFRKIEADLVDGRWVLMTETVGTDGWMLCFGTDITDLGQDQRQLRAAHARAVRDSQVDALTGIGNRAYVLQRLTSHLAAPDPTPVCVGMADLDHFKQINDRLGHVVGDRVLCDFARRLQSGIRRADVCGRIGGEEFLVVLRGTTLPVAHETILRLIRQVRRSRPLADRRSDFSYRCSFGLVQVRPGETLESVLTRVDSALYQAKQEGRDRCACAD